MEICFGIIIVISISVCLYFAVPKIIKWHNQESLNSANRLFESLESDENLLGKFDYTQQEWKYAYQVEFIEDTAARSLMRSSRVSIDEDTKNFDRDEIAGKIVFLPQQIIINNGYCSKIYRFNNLNFLGYGIKLLSINLENTSFMKTLEMKLQIISDEADMFEDSKILIPSSAEKKIDEIYRFYNERSYE